MWNLCSGNTWANPSASSMASAAAAVSWSLTSPRVVASRMSEPIPSFVAVSWAIASASPVTILIVTPIWWAVAMVAAASSRGGSNSGSTPRNCQSPSSSDRATPSERKPRAAKSLTAASTLGLHQRRVGSQRQDDLRRALGHLERGAVGVGDRGLGALVDRVERLEVADR